ncbi:MAG TPA: glycosyl hydrolase family 18 protein [Solirubrobacteraceae bacterium]|jgi:spore germination protein YaaH
MALTMTLTTGLAFGSASARTALQAFVLAGAPDSLTDLEAHARDIGVVYPTFFECEPRSGRILETAPAAVTAYALSQNIAVMPRFNCQDGPTVHAILTDPRMRARTLAALAAIARSPAYAGVNLDLENDVHADRAALTAFARELARTLHASAKKLSIDVDGVTHDDPSLSTGLYDDRALATIADYVFVMAWGTHWEGSGAGPIAPLSYVAGVARYLAALPHSQRFVLGVPMYGLDWPVSGRRVPLTGVSSPSRAEALQYANVLALAHATGATPLRDRKVDEMTFAYTRTGVTHRVWYMDPRAIEDRLRIARAHGLGAGVWRLGAEDQALWSSALLAEGAT